MNEIYWDRRLSTGSMAWDTKSSSVLTSAWTAQSANVTTKWIHKSFVSLLHNSHLNDAFYGHDSGKSRGHNFCGVTYDRIKLAAAILVKGMRSFVDLSAELSNVQYDMTLDGSEQYPSSSELHNIFTQIPLEWMEEALQRLDDLSKEEFLKFEESLDTFVIDGSALSGDTLVERDMLTKIRLVREYFTYHLSLKDPPPNITFDHP